MQKSSAAPTALAAAAGLCTPLSRSWQSQHSLVLFPPARQFTSSLIDGCLKYINEEKPKTGLNYDMIIGPIEARP